MATSTKPLALNESINTTENTPRNIADVLADELSNIAEQIQGGGSGGSGGHIIQNASGANLTQRGTMQFVDSHATDSSANEKTVIENIKPLTRAQFDVVTEDGFYAITDEDDATMEEASADYVEVTADGVKTYATLLSEINALTDWSKITPYAYFRMGGGSVLRVGAPKEFFSASATSGLIENFISFNRNEIGYVQINTNNTIAYVITSSHVPTNGTVLRLYYGTDSCVTNLINQAKYTYMESGESVESAIPKVLSYIDYTIPSQTYTQSSYTQIEGSKTTFGLSSNAKIVNITVIGNNGGLLCAGINDYEYANWLRFRIHNIAGENKTQTLPVRIWYQI